MKIRVVLLLFVLFVGIGLTQIAPHLLRPTQSRAADAPAAEKPAEAKPATTKPAEGNSDTSRSPVGRKIDNFTLRDFRGREVSLDHFKAAKLVVVAFFGTECPLVNHYARPLQELADRYAKSGVTTLVINSNVQDSVTEIVHWAEKHKLTMPVIKDLGNVVADKFGADRTPQFFVLDGDRVIRYCGRIDDQFGIGYQRPEPTEHFLRQAIDELLAGKPVTRSQTDTIGCYIGRVKKPDEASQVTYSKQIARIFQNHCVECHRPGEIAPFPLTSYDEAFGWAEMVDEVVREQRMPPWHASAEHGKFANDSRLTDDEKSTIHRWVEAGAPLGDPKEQPEPKKYVEGWRIGEPEQVLNITPKPFKIPARGQVNYQYFVVDPGFKEDKWIRAAECRPGNRAVVHHIIAFVRPPGAGAPDDDHPAGRPKRPFGTIESDWLVAYAPGSLPMNLPAGLGKFVPAGSKLVFQVHYTPNGSEQLDQSTLGLTFTDASKVKKEVGTWRAVTPRFAIPPGDANYEVKAEHVFRKDSLMLAMFPHMHLRGKAFRYEAVYPDGKNEILLDVPRYDFGWQNSYILASPKLMPAGTRLVCTARYDNSEANLSNPDPKATVYWGDQTWEEMMIGYFSMVLADQDLTKNPIGEKRADAFRRRIKNGDKPVLDESLRKQAAGALASREAMIAFAAGLEKLVPQVDRIDVSTVADGKLTIRHASQSAQLERAAGGEVTIPATKLALAEYATNGRLAVITDLAKERAPDMVFAARLMSSSAHVPIKLNGAPGTVNFWSTETDAFPDEAVAILKAAAEAMVK